MGDRSKKDGVEKRSGNKDRRDTNDDRRGSGRVETEPDSRRKNDDRRKDK
jgi:hypothetical protein|tara:strand:+ start:382 stop:531 length:150 start_codon:yes stop_codon:yes gene_type:complete